MNTEQIAHKLNINFFHFNKHSGDNAQVVWFAHTRGETTGVSFRSKADLHDRLCGFMTHRACNPDASFVAYCGRLGDRILTTMAEGRRAEKNRQDEKIRLAKEQLDRGRKLPPALEALVEDAS